MKKYFRDPENQKLEFGSEISCVGPQDEYKKYVDVIFQHFGVFTYLWRKNQLFSYYLHSKFAIEKLTWMGWVYNHLHI